MGSRSNRRSYPGSPLKTSVIRYPDWDARLSIFLASHASDQFAYGSWDCFEFVRQATQAMTGTNIAEKFRPYHSIAGYLRQIRRYCNSFSLVAFADKLMQEYGARQVERGYAQRGDLALADLPAFGIVALNGRHLLMLAESGEVTRLTLNRAIRVWRI